MKKKLCSIVCLCYFVSIMLCACGRKEQGNPIRLPAREDIVSIGVSDGDKYAISPNNRRRPWVRPNEVEVKLLRSRPATCGLMITQIPGVSWTSKG